MGDIGHGQPKEKIMDVMRSILLFMLIIVLLIMLGVVFFPAH